MKKEVWIKLTADLSMLMHSAATVDKPKTDLWIKKSTDVKNSDLSIG